jgi:hypothetical protein
MSFRSSLDQRTSCSGIFFSNSTCQTQSNTAIQTNSAYLASLQYVQDFTNYFIYLTYLLPSNPTFQGLMNGGSITLSDNLSTPAISNPCNFTGSPTIQGQNIEYDILGEVKMFINELAPNYLLCDGASYPTSGYPYLFNIIGYTYGGSGDNFNVPNFESKFPIGANSSNANNNPTSNFAYGNGTSGGVNTQSVSYSDGVSLINNIPTHAHQNSESYHSHDTLTFTVTDHFYTPAGEGLITTWYASVPNPVPPLVIPLNTAFTGISVLDTGDNIQSIDPISGLNGVNITPSYVAFKFCICFIQNY